MEGLKQDAEKRILTREGSSRDGSDTSSKDIATAREIDTLRREVERLKAELVGKLNENNSQFFEFQMSLLIFLFSKS